jgi:RNA polymerase sigma-70 factor (ECF subfamily)
VTQGIDVESDYEIERVYREQGDRLYYAVLGYTGDREVAREAVAEAFARAINSMDSIRTPVPWVWRVAFRVARDELRRRGRQVPLRDSVVSAPEPPDLMEALAQLSDRQRASIVLHYYAGYSLDEIAEILGTRKGTIGTHLHRGRARLEQLLEVRDG